MVQFTTSDNNYGVAKWIVDPQAGQGTHTTIAAALTASSAGDTIFVRPGTYTENLTLKAVNLVAFTGDTLTVTITGKITCSTSISAFISNIALKTNSDFLLVSSGASCVVSLFGCDLNCLNNTGINLSAATSTVNLYNCTGNIGTTGIGLFSGSGAFVADNTKITNSGLTTTASTTSGNIVLTACNFSIPISVSSTGIITAYNNFIDCSGVNAISITTAGSGTSVVNNTTLKSGTNSAVSIGTGTTLSMGDNEVNSSNTNAITGLGTLLVGNVNFTGSSSTINTSTVTALTSQMGALNLKTPLTGANGGTGVANTGSTITLGGNLTTSGAFASTFTMTNTTGVTFPTSGTLATTAQIPSTPISLANGGTNASLTADNGAIFYSTATAGALLASTATAGQILRSGASSAPSWSTTTYPATNAISTLLYASSANVMGALATANSAILATNSSGVPSITTASGNWLNTTRCAFLAYLATTANNKTGNGTTYTLGTDALTEVFDQGNDFNTNGTFTAPVTGKYFLSAKIHLEGETIATTGIMKIITTARNYIAQLNRAASNSQFELEVNSLCDMTAGNTATVTIAVAGEAGDTVDITGSSELITFFTGYLVC